MLSLFPVLYKTFINRVRPKNFELKGLLRSKRSFPLEFVGRRIMLQDICAQTSMIALLFRMLLLKFYKRRVGVVADCGFVHSLSCTGISPFIAEVISSGNLHDVPP